MLIATLTALYFLFFAGGSEGLVAQFDQIAGLSAEHVTEEDRATEVQSVLDEMRAALDEFQADILDLRQQAWRVDADYGATRADYLRVFSQLDAAWLRSEQRIIELRFGMRDLMTREEWNAVFGALREMRKDG